MVAKLWLQVSCMWHGSDVVQYWCRCGKLCVCVAWFKAVVSCVWFSVSGGGTGMCDMVQMWVSCAMHGPDVVQV